MTLEKEECIVTNLAEFEKLTVKSISPALEEYLKSIAKSGDTCYNWSLVKPLLVYKLERVLDDFMETVTENGDVSAPSSADFQITKDRLSSLLEGFYRAPFTVQRMLELLLEPNKHYKKFDKYSRGLEKVLSVVTTVDPFPKKAPTSLLPNTILNGNGVMRNIIDKQKSLTNGEMEVRQEDCKKRAAEDDHESPKRPKIVEPLSPTRDVTLTTEDHTTREATLTTEATARDVTLTAESTTGDISLTTEATAESTAEASTATQDSEEQRDEEMAESTVMAVSPDSTTNESDNEMPGVESSKTTATPTITVTPTTPSTMSSNGEDEVTTTQELNEVSNKSDSIQTSLSAILSDHPTESGREG